MDICRKLFTGKIVDAGGGPIVAVVSTESADKVGDIVVQGQNERGRGWLLDDFNSRGRVYWMHDPFRPNLAKASAKVDESRLLLTVEFDKADPFAAEIDRKYREGYLSEWSVGFAPIIAESNDSGGETYYEQELHEVSAVNQGMNEDTGVIAKAYSDYVTAAASLDAFDRRLRAIEAAIMRGETEKKTNQAAAEIREAVEALRRRRITA